MAGTVGQPETGSGAITPQAVAGEPVTVEITKPDGTKEAPITVPAAVDGTYSFTYTPTQAGNYSATASVAQQTTSTSVLSTATATATFTVNLAQVNRSITLTFSP